jgi:hypothetical protein
MKYNKMTVPNDEYAHFKFSLKNHTFVSLKKVYIDISYNKYTKIVNVFCLIFYSTFWLIQLHFMFYNFTFDLLAKYGCMMMLTLYVSN